MSKLNIKSALPYIGLPFIILGLLLLKINQNEPFIILLHCLLAILGYFATVIDIKSKKIPNSLVLVMITGWIIVTIPQLFLNIETTLIFLRNSLFGFGIGGGLPLLIYLISRRGIGGGDVKFMAAAGLYLGIYGVLPAMLYGSILAGLTGITLIIIKKIGRKDSIPLAPFLFAGILITVFFM